MSTKSITKIHKFLYGITLIGMLLLLWQGIGSSPAVRAQEASNETYKIIHNSGNCRIDLNEYEMNLDGVDLIVCLPFQVDKFIYSSKKDIYQVASGRSIMDHTFVMIQAIPYGFNFRSLEIPEPLKGSGLRIRDALASAYLGSDQDRLQGPKADIFGMEADSLYSVIRYDNDFSSKKEMNNIWVAEAGERIWIIHVTHDYPKDYPEVSIVEDVEELSSVSLSSTNVNAKSISLALGSSSKPRSSIEPQPSNSALSSGALNDLPFPPWWEGDCDINFHPYSYPLGSQYRGVKACGPLPSQGYDIYHRYFFSGDSVGAYEWMCSELAKRYLYLAYGTAPYEAWGKDIIELYPASNLIKITNGTVGKAPEPGDVIGFAGPDTNYGHAGIVSDSSVDGNGDGYIQYIEQNYSDSGTEILNVDNWWVESPLVVTAWLHDPTQDIPTSTFTPSNTATDTNTATATFTPSNTATYTNTPTATFTPSNTATDTNTPTATFTPSNTATYTNTPTATFTPSNTATYTNTPTATFTPSNTATHTNTPTATFTPSNTATHTNTPTATFTPTNVKIFLPLVNYN